MLDSPFSEIAREPHTPNAASRAFIFQNTATCRSSGLRTNSLIGRDIVEPSE